jgi:2-octaprenyl-6-methoxyphenol hydroxylase
VVDRAALPPMERPDFDGRAYAVAAGSKALLRAAGLWAALPETPNPIMDIRVSDGRLGRPASRLHLHFDHTEAGQDAGPFGWMVEARALRVALNATLHTLPALTVFAPAAVTVDRRADGAVVRVAGGPSIACRLVVAAEGRESPLRESAGIPVTRLPYRQTGIVAAISHELPHHNTALEHFLPGGPFAQLPMAPSADAEAGGAINVSAIVWTERTPIAERVLALDDTRFAAEIARRLGGHLGAIHTVGRRWRYPLSAMLAHRYIDTRLALVGDAAHGIHLGDPALLRRYQGQRRPDNLLMLAATDGLDRLFSNDSRILRAARDIGIATVHRMPRLKRAFMRRAMGLGAG